MSTQVLLADHHRLVREGLRVLLDACPDTKVVGEAGDGPEAIELARELRPNLVITEVDLPGMSGIEVTKHLRRMDPQAIIIALSRCADENSVNGMLQAGASGYLFKEAGFADLLEAVDAAREGQVYLCPVVKKQVAGTFVQT